MNERRPYVFTFYSFKGGVGRSMALINVAYALAALGRHVLMMDMDLEAPGISGFLLRRGELERRPGRDALDLISWATQFAASHPAGPLQDDESPKISEYIGSVRTENLKTRFGKPGRLDLVGAFFDLAQEPNQNYWSRLNALQLPGLNAEQLIRVSSALRAALRNARVTLDLPEYYTHAVSRNSPYDYVLIDSRTGGTEIGGLCVGPIADRVIVFTGLNEQNVQGTKEFIETVGIKQFLEFDKGLDKGEVLFPRLPLDPNQEKAAILVASPIPLGELSQRKERLKAVESELGSIGAWISYHPQMALSESVLVRDFPDEYLAAEYRTLRDRLMQSIGDDETNLAQRPQQYLRERGLEQKQEKLDHGRLSKRALRRLHLILRAMANDGPNIQIGSSSPPIRFENAVQDSLRLAPINPGLGLSLLQQLEFFGQLDISTSDFSFLDQIYVALTKHAGASERRAFNCNWGIALSEHSKCLPSETESAFFFEESCKRFKLALAEFPDERSGVSVISALANAILAYANSKGGESTAAIFEEALRQFTRVLTIAGESPSRRLCRAIAYRDWANRTIGPGADRLFSHAYEDFGEALRLKGKSDSTFTSDVLLNRAITQGFHARSSAGARIQELFDAANSSFDEIPVKSDFTRTIWANVLADDARMSSGDRMETRFNEAYRKYSEDNWMEPKPVEAIAGQARVLAARPKLDETLDVSSLIDRATFQLPLELDADNALAIQHIACTFAILAKEEQCKKWLFRGRDVRNLEPRRLHSDPDLGVFRNRRWFRELMGKFSMINSSAELPLAESMPE